MFMNIHPAYAGYHFLHLLSIATRPWTAFTFIVVEDAARSEDSGQLGQDSFGIRQVERSVVP